MSNNASFNKKNFLISLYRKLYFHPSIVKISDGENIIIPEDNLYEFLHDLNILIEECFDENTTLDY